MGTRRKKEVPEFFDARIKVGGEIGLEVREILEGKMKADIRKTFQDTIVAIILEYGRAKQKKHGNP